MNKYSTEQQETMHSHGGTHLDAQVIEKKFICDIF